jgi:DNA polymerase I
MTTALIDADVLAYQAAAAGEKPVNWGEGLWTLHAYEDEVLAAFESKLAQILSDVKATDYILAFTAPDNFRYSVLPSYKGNRTDKRKPMLLPWIKETAMAAHPSYLKPTLEGDDCLGILATCGRYTRPVICSIDKDMKTIPGRYYDFGKEITYDISEAEADWWHMAQTLSGDATDGYSGCPGVGVDTAKKFLDAPYLSIPYDHVMKAGPRKGMTEVRYQEEPTENLWAAVVSLYESKGLNEAAALQQARVARICRASDYNFKTKEVILWTPKNPSSR